MSLVCSDSRTQKISAKVRLFRNVRLARRVAGLLDGRGVLRENRAMKKAFDSYLDNKDTPRLDESTVNAFKKAFSRFNWQQHRQKHLWYEFLHCDIKLEKSASEFTEKCPQRPIVICVIKDDLSRLSAFLDHYRSLGIAGFAMLDNGSTDGTFELLRGQQDVDLWRCTTPYTTERREAWICRLLAHYGFNRWYLCVDSDELFAYPYYEESTIEEFICACERRRIRRVRAMMLDMYSNKPMPLSDNGDDIRTTYRYFDVDSYTMILREKSDELRGGPRSRVFSDGDSSMPKFLLTKYPLFYFKQGDIQGSSHFQFPYDDNYRQECLAVLMHYKFLARDAAAYIQRAVQGNYASGSQDYKRYASRLENDGGIMFFDKRYSREFTSSLSLLQLKELSSWL